MGKLLNGGVLVFFVIGLTFAGFLLLQEDNPLTFETKPKYDVKDASMSLDFTSNRFTEFVLVITVSEGSLSIIGVNTNLPRWDLTGDFNESVSNQDLIVNLQYIGLGERLDSENINNFYIQLFLSDGNIITWQFGSLVEWDFEP